MTYSESLRILLALERFGVQPGLERIEALLDALDRPEARLRIVHVGGTNGKGSTSAMAASIFEAAGHRVGLYTSPHLLAFPERIRIEGRPLPEATVARGVERIQPLLETIQPTFFEATTALALAAFAEASVDVAVLEVGMGGCWDATTVGRPLVSILTPISYDHQAYLGSRLTEIAAEKAAIIRSGLAASAEQASEVMGIIDARAHDVGIPLLRAGRELHVRVRENSLQGQVIDLAGPGWEYEKCSLSLVGLFQPGNALLAVAGVRASGIPVSETAIRLGLARVSWPGRFQVIREKPTLVLDGAHNLSGAQALASSLRHYFPGQPLTLVVGISRDKDLAGILKVLAPLGRRMILTAAQNPRAAAPAELQAHLPPYEGELELIPSLVEVLPSLLGGPDGVIVVTGSLFLVADALAWFEKSLGH
jgi:dihydrofolate synthase/folylpolyglutamate synthase